MKHCEFLQSREWGLFQEQLGRNVYYLPNDSGDGVLAIALPIIGKQRYVYCPRGPIARSGKELRETLSRLIDLGRTTGAWFVRCEPSGGDDAAALRAVVKEMRGRETIPMQTKTALLLDLSMDEQAILAKMHPKTRYNIRVAQKKNVSIERIVGGGRDVSKYENAFLSMIHETSARKGFYAHEEGYYRELMHFFLAKDRGSESHDQPFLRLYIGSLDGKAFAAAMVLFYKDTASYIHGGSSYEHRDAMAPYLVHWSAIQDAKKLRCAYYDFGGIETASDPNPSWAGMTRFKMGFGGTAYSYPGTFDIALRPLWYMIYAFGRKMARK